LFSPCSAAVLLYVLGASIVEGRAWPVSRSGVDIAIFSGAQLFMGIIGEYLARMRFRC
jgi:hypothetical protein